MYEIQEDLDVDFNYSVVMDTHLWTTWLFFLLHISTFVNVQPITTIVHLNSMNDNKNCREIEDIYCQTIEQAYELVKGKSNVTIIIQNDFITLSQELNFIDVSNIAIKGIVDFEGNFPVVRCSGQAGIYVENSSNIYFSNFILTQCIINSSDYLSAMMFKLSSDIDILNVALQESNASGLTLLDCHGKIYLTSVNFTENGKQINSCTHKFGALNIEVIKIDCFGGYRLQYCVFENNSNEENRNCARRKYTGIVRWGFSRLGGGMRVILATNYSLGHMIYLNSCQFIGNEASYGGGLYLQFQNNSEDNIIQINNTIFLKNVAHYSGGGLNMNFVTERNANKTNRMLVDNTVFQSNRAQYGGGLSVLVSFSDIRYLPEKNMILRNCTWDSNIGTSISPAVDIAPYVPNNSERYGYLMIPLFYDIHVTNNFAINVKKRGLKKTHQKNSGVFLITQLKVHFSGEVLFHSNSPSALQATSSGIILNTHTKMTFDNNSGIDGGAIALYGFSYIYLSKNVQVLFLNNTASGSGGGIYYHGIDQHEFITGFTCFIEIEGRRPENISLIFEGNKAHIGKWIYSESFYNCVHNCHELINYHSLTFPNITKCLGEIKSLQESYAITSSVQNFSLEKVQEKYSVIPGERFSVPFYAFDELHQEVSPLISVTAANTSSKIEFEEQYTINGKLVAIGQENSRTTVDITVIGLRSIFFEFELETIPCSPGFVFDNNTKSCICGYGYKQIVWCDMKKFRAYTDKEYWVGYIPQSSFNYSDLYFAPCLGPICNSNMPLLPRSAFDLNQLVCGPNRSGIMCGKCVANTSVYFHSQRYSCGANKYCHYGLLLYLLSEIIPIILFFLVVVIFDLTFTSGNIVGFLFFSQYFEPLILPTDSTLLSIFQFPYNLFYGIFNLGYFSGEYTAYCLWKHLDTLDIIAIKYISVIFSFALVLILLALLRSGRCSVICNFRSQISKRYSFVHGLSAFLAICYIQCTKTSFLILRYAIPEGLNGKYHHWYTYYGGMPYFQGKHLVYSIVAIFSLIIVTILPTMVLLLHPLLLQLLSLCKLSEHWIIPKALQILHIQKFIPFLDCFQSCYKDRYRFFSGLYHVYRVALLICFMTTDSFSSLLLYVQLLLLLFIGIHALVQPYKERLHNTLDSLIFLNLNLINLLNIFIYSNIKISKLASRESTNYYTIYFQVIQTFLLFLPMLVCIIWLLWKLSRYLKECRNSDTGEDYDKLQQDHILEGNERAKYLSSMY